MSGLNQASRSNGFTFHIPTVPSSAASYIDGIKVTMKDIMPLEHVVHIPDSLLKFIVLEK